MESYQDVLDKIQDYFDEGVQLVWYIVSTTDVAKRQKIYAYPSPDKSTVFTGPDAINALPVISGFQLTVADLFA